MKIVGIGTPDGEGICDAGFGLWRWNDADGIANANLIVRAVNSYDDMLAALKECVNRCRYDGDLHDDHGDETRRDASWEAMRMAEAAIAKADGAVIAEERGT